jgi:hypothetical protein
LKTQLLKLLFVACLFVAGMGSANAAVTTGVASTAGLASGTIYAGENNVPLLAFYIKTTANTTINNLTFTYALTNGTSAANYFSAFKVYASTTNSYEAAFTNGPVAITAPTLTASPITITFSAGQAVNNTTKFYFIVATSVTSYQPTTAATFGLTFTKYNGTAAPTTVAGPTLNLSPPIISYTSPATYIVGTGIAALSPNATGTAIGTTPGYGTATNFQSVTEGPYGVATDGDGNVYTVGNSGGDLYSTTPNGTTTDINATVLSGNSGQDIAINGEGNIFVSDLTDKAVWEFSLSGGTPVGATGVEEFTFAAAPTGIAFDANNNAYVISNGKLYEIPVGSASGTAPTLITTTGVSLANAYGIAIDPSGDIFISIDAAAGTILKIPSGSLVANTYSTGFKNPENITSDGIGDIYIADYGNNEIKEIPTTGTAGTAVNVLPVTQPTGVAIDPNNILYVSTTNTNYIVKSVISGGYTINNPLPAGLSFNITTGIISGTPSAFFGPTTYYVTASSTNGAVSALAPVTISASQLYTTGGYAFQQQITLNTTSFGATSTLTNFPYLVYIQENALKTDSACKSNIQLPNVGATNATDYDFAFTTSSSSTELFYQVESYDPTTGTLVAWVNVPSLTTTTKPTLNFYFGANTPGHNAAFTAGTWASDYQEVYHFNENAASGGTIIDATANANNAVQTNCTSVSATANAGIGKTCYQFSTTSVHNAEMLSKSANTSLTGSYTLSAWVYPTLFTQTSSANGATYPGSGEFDYKIITDETTYTAGGYKLGLYSGSSATTVVPETETRYNDGTLAIDRVGFTGASTPTKDVNLTNWNFVQAVYDNTTNTFYTYLNGVLNNTSTAGYAAGANGQNIFIGADFTAGNYFYGDMDEARVSSNAKSADWIKAEFYNQKAPTKCTTVSATVQETSIANVMAIGGSLNFVWYGSITGSSNTTLASNYYCRAAWGDTVKTAYSTGSFSYLPTNDGSCSLYIPAGAFPPVLPTGIPSFAVSSLTLASGAQFFLNGAPLSVYCHIYNNNGSGGIISSGSLPTDSITFSSSGGISFVGSQFSPQYYYGVTGSVARVADFTAANTVGNVEITGGLINVYNYANAQSDLVIDAAGRFTLKSNATGTANFWPITAGFYCIGNVTAERYLAAVRGYRLLTMPVNINTQLAQYPTSASTIGYIDISSLNLGMATDGPGTGFSYTHGSTVNPLLYLWDESKPDSYKTFVSGKNVGIYSLGLSTSSPAYTDTYYAKGQISPTVPTAKAEIPVGNSVQAYYIGPANATTLSSQTPIATTTQSTGYLNQGTIPVNIFSPASASGYSTILSYSPHTNPLPANSPGFNQVGNPYASTIVLDSVYYDNLGNNISPNFYVLKEPGNTFVAYSASMHQASVAGSGAERYITTGQGFYVVALDTLSSTLTFYEKEKSKTVTEGTTNSSAVPLIVNQKSKTASAGSSSIAASEVLSSGLAGLHLKIAKDTTASTQTGIFFNNAFTDKYTAKEDATDLDGTAPVVYLSSYSTDGIRLCINGLGDYTKGKTVKLYASAVSSGSYTISLADILNIDTLYNVYLRDHKLNDSVDLRKANYTFTITTGDTTTYGANRFDLVLERQAVAPYQLLTFAGQKVSSGVQLNWVVNNAGTYTGFVLQKEGANNTFSPIYTVQSNNGTTYNFVDKNPVTGSNIYRLAQNDINGNITYSNLVTIGYDNVSSNGYFSVYPNPVKSVLNVVVNSTTTTNNTNYTADIFNSSGLQLDHRLLNSYTWTEDVSNYKDGVYVIVLKNINGDVLATAKFIKTN